MLCLWYSIIESFLPQDCPKIYSTNDFPQVYAHLNLHAANCHKNKCGNKLPPEGGQIMPFTGACFVFTEASCLTPVSRPSVIFEKQKQNDWLKDV